MDALPQQLESPPAYYENLDTHGDCYVTRVAYDLGSTATKVIVARVNVCTKTIDQVISEHTYPAAFFEDVSQSDQLLFSEWMQAYALQMMKTAKMQADLDVISVPTLISPRTEQCAVATQAFRLAENGHYLAKELSQRLGIPISTISQEDEGKLAYLSVLSQWQALNRQLPIVWDVGGGSAQLIFKDEIGEFYVVGSDVASRSFQQAVVTQVMHKEKHASPLPMSHQDINQAILLAKHVEVPSSFSQTMIQERIAHHAPIVGIGKVHNLCAMEWVRKCLHKSEQGYSKVDLLTVIDYLANKSDADLKALAPEIPEAHIASQLTNLILIYAQMDKMGIDWVEVFDVNPAWGLLLTGCH